MSLAPIPSLDELARDPARAQDLPPDTAEKLLAQVHVVQGALLARLLAARASASGNGQGETGGDRALDMEEASRLLSTSVDTLYRKWRKLPFAWKDPVDGHIKFSYLGIQKHLRQRQGR